MNRLAFIEAKVITVQQAAFMAEMHRLKNQRIVFTNGCFDLLHLGHITYLAQAASLGDKLFVAVNDDTSVRALEKGVNRPINPEFARAMVLASLGMVDHVIEFNDDNNNSINAIELIKKQFPVSKIVFANGGDRTSENIPEMSVEGVEFAFSVGGDNKMNSSSWILEEWKAPKTDRQWGNYRVLHETGKTLKVKELNVEPGKSLSMQKHEKRSEFWFVAEGYATLHTSNDGIEKLVGVFGEHEDIWIPKEKWHRLSNNTNEMLKLIELQYGEECSEMDILRR